MKALVEKYPGGYEEWARERGELVEPEVPAKQKETGVFRSLRWAMRTYILGMPWSVRFALSMPLVFLPFYYIRRRR